MNATRITISRPMVGVCAALCLGGAVVLWILYPSMSSNDENLQQWIMLKAACTRIGLVMGAMWLALPRGGRQVEVSPKAFVVGFIAFVGLVLRPKFFLPLLVAVAILAVILRPRDKNRAKEKLARWYRVKTKEGKQ